MTPDELTVAPDFQHLILDWPDGTSSRLPAETLRREARDAATRRRMIDHGFVEVAKGLSITGLNLIGNGAVNITFSDGHDRAIYPWPYLRSLAQRFGN
ncbi:MAG: DUF971 domain-containing protein [Pseudomonadota bacterium]